MTTPLPLAVLVVAWTATRAQAQWVVSPYLGINLAGNVEFRRGGPGGSAGYFGDRVGFELDFERYNHFFKDMDVASLVPNNCGVGPAGEPCTDLNTDAMSFMGNLWRPFTSGRAALASIRYRRARRDSRLVRCSRRPVRHRTGQPPLSTSAAASCTP